MGAALPPAPVSGCRWERGCSAPWGALQTAAALLRYGVETEVGEWGRGDSLPPIRSTPGALYPHARVPCPNNYGWPVPA